ncbi:MAG: DUF3108 domain-containing protein [Caldithrix sp.]|nr:DUF3108 domain-containing protein [Caldithrix sp.]
MVFDHGNRKFADGYIKIGMVILMLLVLSAAYISADDQPQPLRLNIGEEYTYGVKWGFARLGTLKILMEDTVFINDERMYKIKFKMDSNPLLFFVNIHSIFESYLDDNFRLHKLISHEEVNDTLYKANYQFNYDKGFIDVLYQEINDTTQTIDRRFPLTENMFGSVALVFYARANAYQSRIDTVTAFHETRQGKVLIRFKGEGESIEIDALDHAMQTYYIDGEIFMQGIAGVTGPFKGWFSRDDRRIPLKAELKVFIGSVKVELEDWTKWNPPKMQ